MISIHAFLQGDTLLDFILSENDLWGMWLSREMEGDSKRVLVKQATYDG